MEGDNRKFTILSFFLGSALVAYVLYLVITQIADWMHIGGSHAFMGFAWPMVGGSIAGLLGLILFLSLSFNRKSSNFIDEVFLELRKTTWPTMKQTSTSTLVVTIMVGIAAFLLFVMDYFWHIVFQFIL